MKLSLAIDNIGELEFDDYLSLIRRYELLVDSFKIGLEAFLLYGPKALGPIENRSFLDLKFHDIPNTVGKATNLTGEYKILYLTVHGVMEKESLRSVAQNAGDTKILAVTKLTSSERVWCLEEILATVDKCFECGITGFVCPVDYSEHIKTIYPESFIVSPGIRLSTDTRNDQIWVASPQQAFDSGVDMIVLGRAIFEAENPLNALESIQKYRTK